MNCSWSYKAKHLVAATAFFTLNKRVQGETKLDFRIETPPDQRQGDY